MVQCNDDFQGVATKNRKLEPQEIVSVFNSLLTKMVLLRAGLSGLHPTSAWLREDNRFSIGNFFIIEHICVRITQRRFRLSTYTSKIDIERSAASYLYIGPNVRSDWVCATSDKNKEGGFGSFAERNEERDARGLVALYPELLKKPHALQSGQWTVQFEPLFPSSLALDPLRSDLRKETKEGKHARGKDVSEIPES